MAYFGKEFKIEKEENIEEFIEAIDAGERAKFIFSLKPNQKITKDGDEYELAFVADGDVKKKVKFTSGATLDEALSEEFVAKSTFTVDGDTITQVMDFGDKGTITQKREFAEDSLKITITASFWGSVAYRYYKAA